MPNLRVVFCGTAAGEVAARVGAPYAGPGNRFWWVLHEVGFTPRELRPLEFRDLPRYGIGLTDVAKHAVGGDKTLRTSDFDAPAVVEKVERFRPSVLAFVGKRAASEVLQRPGKYGENAAVARKPGGYGRQDVMVGGARVWILPSTSGAARGFWDVGPWRALAAAIT